MPRREHISLSRQHLAAAAAHLRRPSWPAELDDVLAHELLGPCVRGLARCLARGEPLPRSRPEPDELHRMARAAHHPGGAPAGHRPGQQAVPRLRFDPRRAAANDHDEPDDSDRD